MLNRDGVTLADASYLRKDPADSLYGVPFGCSQELCSGRQSGDKHPQKDDTIDLAYARWIFARAVDWGKQLGEPAATLEKWSSIAGSLKQYPLTDQFAPPSPHGGPDRESWCADSNCTGFSEAINTDLNRSQIMWANYHWPIANFAPMHPTGQVSLGSDNQTKVIARNTIWLVNNHSHWHGVNGICLSWPPAARMMDKHDPYPFGPAILLDTFEAALKATMQPNFWPSMGGGGLEQVGATQAINELMLQSFEPADKGSPSDGTFLRFFPGWPIGETASFRSLRTQGGFLVDASVDSSGDVSGVVVTSTIGGSCTFLGFSEHPPAVRSRGKEVSLVTLGQGLYKFATAAGQRYGIQ